MFALVFVALVLSACIVAVVHDDEGDAIPDRHVTFWLDGIGYKTSHSHLEVEDVNLQGEMVIPSTITYDGKEYRVTCINGHACYEKKITSLVMPDTIDTMGRFTFEKCRT